MKGLFLYDGDCGFSTAPAHRRERHATGEAGIEAS